MSAEWFDLGQRLKAAVTGTVVPRLVHAPLLPVPNPVAVQVRRSRGGVQVSAATGQARETAAGVEALARLGVSLDSLSPWTLVCDGPGTLHALVGLARRVAPGSDLDATAACVGWWAERADFPSGLAVADVVTAAQARWVTGQPPEAERRLAGWSTWLRLPAGVDGLLAAHRLLCAGQPLPWLTDLAADDEYSFGAARKALSDGWDWRRPDPVSRAAVGLRSRCDAAELYAAGLLADPLWRARQVQAGQVVVGELVADVATNEWVATLCCERLDARLRVGAEVRGWVGQPSVPVPPGGGWVASVAGAVVAQGRLVLTLRLGSRSLALLAGSVVTLMPAPPSVWRQRSGLASYRRLQYSRASWLTSGRRPTLSRRAVPLDVLLAGADDGCDVAGGA